MCAPMLDRLETLPGPQEKALEVAVGIRNGKTNCRRTSDRPTGTARLSALTGGCDQVRSLTAEHFERALGNGANIRFCSGRESEMLIRAAAGGQSRLSQHGPEARPKLRSQFRDPKQVVDTPNLVRRCAGTSRVPLCSSIEVMKARSSSRRRLMRNCGGCWPRCRDPRACRRMDGRGFPDGGDYLAVPQSRFGL